MTVQTDNYGIGASGTASQKFTLTAPNDGTLKIGRGVLGAESSFPIVVNADDTISGVFSGLGVGQTWQDVTGSRAVNVDYTNSTGKPIVVSGYWTNTAASTITWLVSGLTVGKMTAASSAPELSFSMIVPNGATYRVTLAGTGVLTTWKELR